MRTLPGGLNSPYPSFVRGPVQFQQPSSLTAANLLNLAYVDRSTFTVAIVLASVATRMEDGFVSVVEFGTPPVSVKSVRSQRWVDVVAALQGRPGEWARVGEFSPGVATHIRKGSYKHFLHGIDESVSPQEWMAKHWEISTKKVGERRRDEIWMRWVP